MARSTGRWRSGPALILITTGAANALAVYPHLARGLFGTDARSPELVEHYAEQIALLIGRLGCGGSGDQPSDGTARS